MLNLWGVLSNKDSQIEVETSKCYVGVASERYGKSFDIQGLCQGKFDESFKTNQLHFQLTCRIFDTYDEAFENTKRRSVTKDSAFVLEIACNAENLPNVVKEGTVAFSKLITKVTNVTTLESQPINHFTQSSPKVLVRN